MGIKIVRFLASLVLVLTIPLTIITSNAKWAALNPAVYEAGHVKLGVADAMGVTSEQVRAATAAIIEYLQSSPNSLPELLAKHGVDSSFFSSRDMVHFVDVHGLVQMLFQTQLACSLLVVLCLAAVLVLYDKRRDERVAARILWGSGLAAALIVLLGLVSVTNFDSVFLQFHLIAFTNDFWILDPAVDRLIVMFPPTFFYDMMLRVAMQALVQSLGIAAVASAYLAVKKRGRWRTVGTR